MSRFHRLRTSAHFAPWFAAVHPFFWPILWWQIERTIRWMKAHRITNVLITIDWWGGVRLAYIGDKAPDPSAYRPYVPETPRWDDPVWSSDMPANLAAPETLWLFPILPGHARGGGNGLGQMPAVRLPPHSDTS